MVIGKSTNFFQRLKNNAPQLDLIFGLRAWGMILYGALPANLALLGILEVKVESVGKILPFLLPVTLLPLLITFLLIRSRHKDWYLTTQLLNTRSIIVTLLITICATLISGASGIIQGKYVLSLSQFGSHAHLISIAESFLLGIGSLVLTSTLFLALLTKDGNLPGLPSSEFVKSLADVRVRLKQLRSYSIWQHHTGFDADELIKQAKELKESLDKIMNYPDHHLAKMSLEPIRMGLTCFSKAVTDIKNDGNKQSKLISWTKYFSQAKETAKVEQPSPVTAPISPADLLVLIKLRLGK